MTQTAQTYGEALYELARDEGVDAEILEQLNICVELFQENPQLTALLSLPSVPKKERCAVLDTCFKGRVHSYLLNFMKILMENNTIRQLSGCKEAFGRRYNEENGILPVTAVVAAELEPVLEEKLKATLAAVKGKKIELSVRVDPQVLGGVRLEIDGSHHDGTVRCKLNDMKRVLRSAVF